MFVDLLVKAGALLARDALGRTPLHVAAFTGNTAATAFLCSHLASHVSRDSRAPPSEAAHLVDADTADVFGLSAYDLAMLNGFEDTAHTLLVRCGVVATTKHVGFGRSEGQTKAAHGADASASASASASAGAGAVPGTDAGGWDTTEEAPPSWPPSKAESNMAEQTGQTAETDQTEQTQQTGGIRHAIDTRTNLSPEDFFRDYFVPRKPVLVTGAAMGWKIRRTLEKERFIAEYVIIMNALGDPYGCIG